MKPESERSVCRQLRRRNSATTQRSRINSATTQHTALKRFKLASSLNRATVYKKVQWHLLIEDLWRAWWYWNASRRLRKRAFPMCFSPCNFHSHNSNFHGNIQATPKLPTQAAAAAAKSGTCVAIASHLLQFRYILRFLATVFGNNMSPFHHSARIPALRPGAGQDQAHEPLCVQGAGPKKITRVAHKDKRHAKE